MAIGELSSSGERRDLHPALRVVLVVGVAILMAATVRSLKVGPVVILRAKKARLQNEMVQVQTAALSYYTEYADYPVASDNATLIKMLTGLSAQGNPRQIAFLTVKPSDQDAQGEMLDPWGTPLQLSVTSHGKLHARSAGPDKIFGTPDDIIGDKNLGPP